MTRPAEPQPLSLTAAIIPIAALIVLVSISFYLFGDAGALGPNQVALVVAAMVAVYVGWRNGHTTDALREAAVASVGSGISAIFILLAVGALIGTWAMSGTLVAMVYYGLKLLSPNYFYATTTLICGIVALCIGSSWTVVGTIGIGLMGIAANMGLNPAIAAGAVISGAYLGDKASPLSDTANLAAAVAGVNLYAHLKETAITSVVGMVITLAFFWFLGRPGDFDASDKVAAMQAVFHITPWLFLPLIVVVVLALFRFPPFTTIFIGALAGGVLAAIVAPERVASYAGAREGVPGLLALVKGVWLALADGYKLSSGQSTVDTLVTRGGMESMLNTIWLIITALGFGGIVEKIGALDRIIAPVLAVAKSAGTLVASLVASSIATNIATADQYMAVVLPGRMFKGAFAQRGLAPVVLSRSIGDTGTPTGALIPWNSCGAFMAATLGVATVSYAPYAILNIVSPIITVAFAFLGIRMMRTDAPAHGEARKAGKSDA
jgi:Na+:H+ antiporter, NhaC family